MPNLIPLLWAQENPMVAPVAQAPVIVPKDPVVVQREVHLTLDTIGQKIIEYIPRLIGFALVLLLGLLVAWVLSRFARMIAENLGLQNAAERSGLAKSMRDVGIEKTLPQIVSQVVYWLCITLVLMLAVQQLQIDGFQSTVASILAFFPKLIVALPYSCDRVAFWQNSCVALLRPDLIGWGSIMRKL